MTATELNPHSRIRSAVALLLIMISLLHVPAKRRLQTIFSESNSLVYRITKLKSACDRYIQQSGPYSVLHVQRTMRGRLCSATPRQDSMPLQIVRER